MPAKRRIPGDDEGRAAMTTSSDLESAVVPVKPGAPMLPARGTDLPIAGSPEFRLGSPALTNRSVQA